jgi:hypothetical protein
MDQGGLLWVGYETPADRFNINGEPMLLDELFLRLEKILTQLA